MRLKILPGWDNPLDSVRCACPLSLTSVGDPPLPQRRGQKSRRARRNRVAGAGTDRLRREVFERSKDVRRAANETATRVTRLSRLKTTFVLQTRTKNW